MKTTWNSFMGFGSEPTAQMTPTEQFKEQMKNDGRHGTYRPSNRYLATELARRIFAMGDEEGSPAKRIQFKGGQWPDKETNQGGIGEQPLDDFLRKTLDEINPQ